MVFSAGGVAQGVSFLLSGLVIVPVLGRRGCLLFGCCLFTLSPLLTSFAIKHNLAAVAAR